MKIFITLLLFSTEALYAAHNPKKMCRKMFEAVSGNRISAVAGLLKAGADPNCRNYFRRTPLMIAAQRGNWRLIRLLATGGARINAMSCYKETALMFAAQWGNIKSVRELIRFKADPFLRDRMGRTALMLAKRGRLYRRHTRGSGGQHHEYATWVQTAEYKKIARILRRYMNR